MLPTLALALMLPAAPVPKETEREKIEKLFGKIVDPKCDCQFKLDVAKLLVTLPANETRDLDAKQDHVPKLTHGTLKGDFTIQLRVTAPIPWEAGAGPLVKEAFIGGGLVFHWPNDKRWSWLGVGRRCDRLDKRVRTAIAYGFPGTGVSTHNEGLGVSSPRVRSEAPLLRYSRRGTTLAVEASDDGMDWFEMSSCDSMPVGDVTVALYAIHSSDKARTVTFSEFSVTPLREEKK
jgi:hypothetical protein